MMFAAPSNIQTDSLSITGSVADTSTNFIIVAAPGAGFRYRIWGYTIANGFPPGQISPHAGWRATLRVAGSVIYHTMNGFAGDSKDFFFPGGLAFQTNAAISIDIVATVYHISLRATVLYTIESI